MYLSESDIISEKNEINISSLKKRIKKNWSYLFRLKIIAMNILVGSLSILFLCK